MRRLLVPVLLTFGLVGCSSAHGSNPQPTPSPRAEHTVPAAPSSSPSASPSKASPDVFDDEFDGTSLDTAKWVRESGHGYGAETFVADSAAARLDGNGHLDISSVRGADGTWRSGELSTRGIFSMKTGIVEFRAKLPREQGGWPALWFHNSIHGETGPPHAEIDVAESFPGGGGDGPGAYLTLHDWSGGPNIDRPQNLKPDAQVLDGQFHTWRMTWEPSKIALSIDGVPQGALTRSSFTAGRWVFDDLPMYFIMGISIGGQDSPAPAADTKRMDLVLDYIRMHRTS